MGTRRLKEEWGKICRDSQRQLHAQRRLAPATATHGGPIPPQLAAGGLARPLQAHGGRLWPLPGLVGNLRPLKPHGQAWRPQGH